MLTDKTILNSGRYCCTCFEDVDPEIHTLVAIESKSTHYCCRECLGECDPKLYLKCSICKKDSPCGIGKGSCRYCVSVVLDRDEKNCSAVICHNENMSQCWTSVESVFEWHHTACSVDCRKILLKKMVRLNQIADRMVKCICGKLVKDYGVCSRCKSVCYCSRTCQMKDWKSHKNSCIPEKKKDFMVNRAS